ncbi:hypothetical protein TNIN_208731 [Trichonephila inaurata madagascariensis]|uniref:Uncharacterized protein n=1 Tax=Trichonephila inaurata madagascariensis TaxID=2747483 RepID=A0A8X7C0N0_9ARAC|nr:hypothetical protein TNIN_208731 [Trichonephila inaurata madagascariensis]
MTVVMSENAEYEGVEQGRGEGGWVNRKMAAFLPFDCITPAVGLNGPAANAPFSAQAHSTADGNTGEWARTEKKGGDRIIYLWDIPGRVV